MKKKIIIGLACLSILAIALPLVAGAQFGINEVETGLANTLPTETKPTEFAAKIINIALSFLGLIAVVIVLYGGFMWMTAGGNEERITKAKQILTAGIIGLVIIIMAWAIAKFVIEKLIEIA